MFFGGLDEQGATRKITFDPYGDLIKPLYTLFEVQQGQWKSIKTIGGGV
jgi:branched-chain amino acid transport system substrate-binding protein